MKPQKNSIKVHIYLILGTFVLIGCNRSKSHPENPNFPSATDNQTISAGKPSKNDPNYVTGSNETKVEWDNSIQNQPKDDTSGWVKTAGGSWVDTMRDYKHIYNAWPPQLEGRVYYPNYTVYLPQLESNASLINPADELKVYVKALDQSSVGWLHPFKSSKLLENLNVSSLTVGEVGPKLLTGFFSESGGGHPNLKTWVYYSIFQRGEVLISEISTWKSENYADVIDPKTEVKIINSLGKEIASFVRDGIPGGVGISKNMKFIALSWGGQFTEDYQSESAGAIYDVSNAKFIWSKTSTKSTIGVGLFNDSNLIKVRIFNEQNNDHLENEYFLLDFEENIFYKYDNGPCRSDEILVNIGPPLEIYCNSNINGKLNRNLLSLENDFIKISHLP